MKQQQDGFTLVELAIALMVIGLLIGGVLKGQELIGNAQITRTIKDLNDINTATIVFDSVYESLPGDMINPQSHIPDCTTQHCTEAGDDNGRIGFNHSNVTHNLIQNNTVMYRESRRYWVHLVKSGILSNIIDASYTGLPNTLGVDFPATKLGGAFYISYMQPSAASENFPFYDQQGHYFVVVNRKQVNSLASNTYADGYAGHGWLEHIVGQIDHKIDDGKPLTGNVRAAIAGSCVGTGNQEYRLGANNSNTCPFAFRGSF